MNSVEELDHIAGYALWAKSYPAHAHNPFMLAEERSMLSQLPASLTGRRVLDVGCGSGRYLLHARKRGATVFGVDQSVQMLLEARARGLPVTRGSVTDLPVINGWADVAICALTLGHIADLRRALAELARVLSDRGTLLCSDFHPVADALGWKRTFNVDAQRYAVRFTTHRYADWHAASLAAGLRIDAISEPLLDSKDIATDHHFDPRALTVPVAIVFKMSKANSATHT